MSLFDDLEKAVKAQPPARPKPFIWVYAWHQRGRRVSDGYVHSEAEGVIAAEAHIKTVDSTHVRYMDAKLTILERRRNTAGSLAHPA